MSVCSIRRAAATACLTLTLALAESQPIRAQRPTLGDFRPSWSPDGRSVVFQSTRDGNDEIYRIDVASGSLHRLTDHLASDAQPSWSPDGRRIVFASDRNRDQYSGRARYQLYSMDQDGGDLRRLAETDSADFLPRWSPDGRSIAFLSDRGGRLGIFVMSSSGESNARTVLPDGFDGEPGNPTWSPDSHRIAFDAGFGSEYDIYAVALDSHELTRLTRSPESEWFPVWSPDGRHLLVGVFAGEGESKTHELVTVELGSEERARVTKRKSRGEKSWDFWPSWSPDGRRLAFASNRSGEWRLFTVRADGSDERSLDAHPHER